MEKSDDFNIKQTLTSSYNRLYHHLETDVDSIMKHADIIIENELISQ